MSLSMGVRPVFEGAMRGDVMAQAERSFSAYFVAAAFFLSVAFACGCEDCD
jgi:hypothetical protein